MGVFLLLLLIIMKRIVFEIWVFDTADGKLIGKENYAVQGPFFRRDPDRILHGGRSFFILDGIYRHI